MPGVYVGDTKSLVFPMLCDGYIKQAYSDQGRRFPTNLIRPENTFRFMYTRLPVF